MVESQIIQVLCAFIVFLLIVVIILAKGAYFWKNKYKTLYNTQVKDVWGRRWVFYSTKTQEKWFTDRQDIYNHIRQFLTDNSDKYGDYIIVTNNISSIDVDLQLDIYEAE